MSEKTQKQPSAELCQYWLEFMWKHGAIQKTYEQEMEKCKNHSGSHTHSALQAHPY